MADTVGSPGMGHEGAEPATGSPAPRALELAVEIDRAMADFVADPAADPHRLAAWIDGLPERERHRLVLDAFAELSAERRWEVLADLFEDDELREVLAARRSTAIEDHRATSALHGALAAAARAGSLDLRTLAAGTRVEIGLFRAADRAAAADRGATSDVCARSLSVRIAGPDGSVRVLDDRFNPRGGLFVTPDYDRATWDDEHLAGHAVALVGAAEPGADSASVEPVLEPGARLDVSVGGALRRGRLHVGWVKVGDVVVLPT